MMNGFPALSKRELFAYSASTEGIDVRGTPEPKRLALERDGVSSLRKAL